MGGKKQFAKCSNPKAHQSHVWSQEAKKVWCPGVEEKAHVHDWERGLISETRETEFTLETALSNGPHECSCGMSVWLTNGRRKRDLPARFPHADALERIMALRARLANEKEKWSPEDQAEFEAIGEALVAAYAPLVEAFQKMAEQVVAYMQSFFDKIDPEQLAKLAELAKAHGEKPDEVNTIDLVDAYGTVVETVVITPPPVSAVEAMSLTEDEDQLNRGQYAEWDPWDDRTTPLAEQHSYGPGDVYPTPFEEPTAGSAFRPRNPEAGLGHLGTTDPQSVINAIHSIQSDREGEAFAARAAQDALLNETLRRYKS